MKNVQKQSENTKFPLQLLKRFSTHRSFQSIISSQPLAWNVQTGFVQTGFHPDALWKGRFTPSERRKPKRKQELSFVYWSNWTKRSCSINLHPEIYGSNSSFIIPRNIWSFFQSDSCIQIYSNICWASNLELSAPENPSVFTANMSNLDPELHQGLVKSFCSPSIRWRPGDVLPCRDRKTSS